MAVRICIEEDEEFPVYFYYEEGNWKFNLEKSIEITEEEKAMIDKAVEDYSKAQQLLSDKWSLNHPRS